MHVFNCSAGVCIHVREQVRALKVVEQLCTNVFTDGALMAHYLVVVVVVVIILYKSTARI